VRSRDIKSAASGSLANANFKSPVPAVSHNLSETGPWQGPASPVRRSRCHSEETFVLAHLHPTRRVSCGNARAAELYVAIVAAQRRPKQLGRRLVSQRFGARASRCCEEVGRNLCAFNGFPKERACSIALGASKDSKDWDLASAAAAAPAAQARCSRRRSVRTGRPQGPSAWRVLHRFYI
jgi:hypothetical protein